MKKPRCGAKTRSGKICQLIAGFKTPHVGSGRCYLHGGLSTGPKEKAYGNKNAVKTGEHETLFLNCLTNEEKELFNSIDTNVKVQLEEELRLINIRIKRMLERIKDVKKKDFVVVKKKEENSAFGSKSSEEHNATLCQIQSIEEALTRVQAQKSRIIEQIIKLNIDKEYIEGNSLTNFVSQLEKIRKKDV